jgi:hypothetical protein
VVVSAFGLTTSRVLQVQRNRHTSRDSKIQPLMDPVPRAGCGGNTKLMHRKGVDMVSFFGSFRCFHASSLEASSGLHFCFRIRDRLYPGRLGCLGTFDTDGLGPKIAVGLTACSGLWIWSGRCVWMNCMSRPPDSPVGPRLIRAVGEDSINALHMSYSVRSNPIKKLRSQTNC